MTAATLTARSERPSLLRLGRVEARKMADTRSGMWLIGLTALAAFASVLVAVIFDDDARDFGQMFVDAMLAASVLMPIIPILLVTGEWSQRTALGTFALTPVRERVMAAKMLALLALLVAFSVFCLAMAALGGAVAGTGLGFDGDAAARVLLYEALNLLFGFGLAAILMNSPAAIVLNFIVPIIVAAVAAISAGVESVVAWVDPSVWANLADATTSDWDKIATSAAAWVVLPIALGLVRLRGRDVS